MTEKLYENNGHIKDFEGIVVSVRDYKDKYAVILDRTAFFPEGGGQSSDTGLINNLKVLDVRNVQGEVLHIMNEPLKEGELVKGVLDYEKRFDRMQQHSGEHIVSGIVNKKFGYNNVGFNLGEEKVTLDFDGVLTQEDIKNIEIESNEAVFRNEKIEILYPSKEELSSINYRSKKEISGQVRLVNIKGIDLCACCAPHVDKTGEIGLIKITDSMNYKGGVRLTMKCGRRALADSKAKSDDIKKISQLLSVKEGEVFSAVEKLLIDRDNRLAEIKEIKEKLVKDKALKYRDEEGIVILFVNNYDSNEMRLLVNLVKEGRAKGCAIFNGEDGDYVFNISFKEIDARPFAKALRDNLGAKGGGKPEMVQGKTSGTMEEIKTIINDVFDGLN